MEWKSFAVKPHNGQPVIVTHEKEETRYAGRYVETAKESFVVVIDYVSIEPLSVKTQFISAMGFTHWKEV